MIDTYQLENQQLKQELKELRKAIFKIEPMVMYDGRFDKMIISPITTVAVAKQLLQELAHLRQQTPLVQ